MLENDDLDKINTEKVNEVVPDSTVVMEEEEFGLSDIDVQETTEVLSVETQESLESFEVNSEEKNENNTESFNFEEEDFSNEKTSDDYFENTDSVDKDDEMENSETVTVQPVTFTSFDDSKNLLGESNKNLDMLLDIKLQLTVELGRTTLPIKKVIELTRGSIVELDKIAGEPVELYANGKLIAHGEVVVIEDNFGLRITNITDPDERLKGL